MDNNQLKGKIAFITGAGGGIGSEVALSLASKGVKVVLLGGNNLEKLAKTEQGILSLGAECAVVSGNLTNDKALEQAFNKAVEKFGGVDILINNAGMAFNEAFAEACACAVGRMKETRVSKI